MTTIAIIGAGSVSFTRTLVSDILQQDATSDCELRLFDIDAESNQAALELVESLRREADAPGGSRLCGDLDSAVRGADYIITTILVGGRSAAVGDFELTGRYGLHYTVGDTLGVAGIARAMRTIPALVEIARRCSDLAPNGLLLNYTNPMGMLVTAVGREVGYPMLGLCHSADFTAKTLAAYIGIPTSELEWWSAGINHLAWMLKLSRAGTDLYPDLARAASVPDIYARDRVRFDLMKRFGYFVTESSKHVSEYLAFYISRPSEVERLSVPVGEFLTRRPVPIADQIRKERDGSGGFLRPPSNEYAPAVIAAVESGSDYCFQANVMNDGLIDDLPNGICVEVPCLVSRGQVAPVRVDALPKQLAALCRQAMNVQDLAVDAVLSGNRDRLMQAILLDPQASSEVSVGQIDALTTELTERSGVGEYRSTFEESFARIPG